MTRGWFSDILNVHHADEDHPTIIDWAEKRRVLLSGSQDPFTRWIYPSSANCTHGSFSPFFGFDVIATTQALCSFVAGNIFYLLGLHATQQLLRKLGSRIDHTLLTDSLENVNGKKSLSKLLLEAITCLHSEGHSNTLILFLHTLCMSERRRVNDMRRTAPLMLTLASDSVNPHFTEVKEKMALTFDLIRRCGLVTDHLSCTHRLCPYSERVTIFETVGTAGSPAIENAQRDLKPTASSDAGVKTITFSSFPERKFADIYKDMAELFPDSTDCEISRVQHVEDFPGLAMNSCFISSVQDSEQCELSLFDVPANGDCFWYAVSHILGEDALTLKARVCEMIHSELVTCDISALELQARDKEYAAIEIITLFCSSMNVQLTIRCVGLDNTVSWSKIRPAGTSESTLSSGYLNLDMVNAHYNIAMPKAGCVIRAIAESLKTNPAKILSILTINCSPDLTSELRSGLGIQRHNLEEIFKHFDICAHISGDGTSYILNESGSLHFSFSLTDDHMVFNNRVDQSSIVTDLRNTKPGSIIPESEYKKFASKYANTVSFEPSYERALKLQESLLRGQTGVLNSKILYGQKAWLENKEKLRLGATNIEVIVGVFGSGKSYNVTQLIKSNINLRNVVISPRKQLKNQLIENLGLASGRKKGANVLTEVFTFEVALKKSKLLRNSRIFIDETQLLPPGYIDLICLISGQSSSILVMGDPAQSSYDSADDRAVFHMDEGNLDVVLKDKKYTYLIESKRFKNPMFNGRLPCLIDESRLTMPTTSWAEFSSFEDMKKDRVFSNVNAVLVSAFAEKKVVGVALRDKIPAYTFGESTGLTFDNVAIVLSQDSMHVEEKRWLVALSRARESICFINLSGSSLLEFVQAMHPSFLSRFLTTKASTDDLRAILPGNPSFSKVVTRIGSDEVDREDRLEGDPWLKGRLFLGERTEVPKVEIPEIEVPSRTIKVHCPVELESTILAFTSHKIKAKEHREKRLENLVTDQFPEEHKQIVGAKVLTNAAERFSAIYPHHKANDTATFLMAARKRLVFSTPDVEGAKLRAALPYGETMLRVFLDHVRLDNSWDQSLFNDALAEFEEKKLQKSKATIENHSSRSDPEWEQERVLLFMKSQTCTKFDNRFRDAKAGQTLACFQHDVLCNLAPWIRYIEKKVVKALPQRYYIHSGKNFDDLQEWVLKSNFSGECTESDYEAFDSSQDATILAFEIALMKYLRFPTSFISYYKYLKMNSRSKLGDMAVMRFTGEAATFLFNTLANMVFTFMRYDVGRYTCIAFAGDDMCANKRMRVSSKFDSILNRLKLKAKVAFTQAPTFCGWCLLGCGIYKRPQLVSDRLRIAIEEGNLRNCIDNYAIEISYAYNLSERLDSIMSEEELICHFDCVRTIVKNKHLCKSDISELFSGSMICPSPERLYNGVH